ncbi:Hypothetical protein I595_1981 [Croceitalea dokdonensis DOKDO 023]|uniref:Uncharacterized protein n=1 Tax=Croceitalea dokdonensis DOKDO 023 TaxID=1300341 RepID=A0A0P7A6F9_9FLAO|nr:Hypothetical protein I595_1981 [Croceitalea dokdonensis DOKDO 023]
MLQSININYFPSLASWACPQVILKTKEDMGRSENGKAYKNK